MVMVMVMVMVMIMVMVMVFKTFLRAILLNTKDGQGLGGRQKRVIILDRRGKMPWPKELDAGLVTGSTEWSHLECLISSNKRFINVVL